MLRLTLVGLISLLTYVGTSQSSASVSVFQEELKLLDPYSLENTAAPLKKARHNRVSRLIKRGDEFFDRMWYAEAAESYDLVLKQNPEEADAELLRRAGDAHYFNTNMKMAFKWYDLLYKKYKDQIGDEQLFRYGHSLQGVGRFSRAKRMMRLAERMETADDVDRNAQEEKLSLLEANKTIEVVPLSNNSPFSDFSPMYIEDGSLVFASSRDSSIFETNRYKWTNQPYLDLYQGAINSEEPNKLDGVKRLSKNINSKYHEAAVAVTPDGNTMYFTRNNFTKKLKRDQKGVNHLKLYKSVKVDGKWGRPTELNINSDSYSTGHPAVSPDGKKLFFISDMPGGYGETDIYVADINENGSISNARNLGKTINSEKKEMFPFVTADQLYFSSDRSFGVGGLDVYAATYAQEVYELATNLGEPINSNKDDFSYIIDSNGSSGYFASNRSGGVGDDDIYYFKDLSIEAKTLKSAIVGVVFEKMTGRVIPNAVVQLMDADSNPIAQTNSDEFGNFEFTDLLQQSNYVLSAEKEDYQEKVITIETENLEEVSANLLLEPIENKALAEKPKKTYHMFEAKPIFFDFERFSLREMSKNELSELALFLKENTDMAVRIESHTDSRGSKAFNKWLSQERANATKDHLLQLGVDPGQIQAAVGYGEEKPLNECVDGVACSRYNHQLNRRSEFFIVQRSI